MPFKARPVLAAAALVAGLLESSPAAPSLQPPWLMIDTRALTLTVLSGDARVLARFRNIAIGSGGVASLHRAGDSTTPLGTFHVAWTNRHSRSGTFFGLVSTAASGAE